MRGRIFVLLLGVCLSSLSLAEPFKGNFAPDYVPNELIVKYRSPFINPNLHGALVVHRYDSGALLLRIPTEFNGSIEKFADLILTETPKEIEYVEPNYVLTIDALPGDPSFAKLWGMNSPSDIDIDAPEAWDISKGSKKVTVAIIDTGVDCKHPDLVANCATNPGEMGKDAQGKDKSTNKIDDDKNGFVDDWRGWDFVSNDNDPTDDQGHGTHVAGTIGAVGNNSLGVAGVNWQVSIIALKFLDASGSGTLDAATQAIDYATKLGVVVSNNSWGGGGFSKTMYDAISKANTKGILFVAAAGNESNDNDLNQSYPASYALDNVISVAAINPDETLAGFSNYGLKTVHLAAPGVGIYSTYLRNSYANLSGTSMAAPHVTGAVALLKAAKPMASAKDLKAKILLGVDKSAKLAKKVSTGGRLNINNTLRLP